MDKPFSAPVLVRAGTSKGQSKSRPGTDYPFYLGGLATAMAGTITHPLDLTKVRMQTMDPKPGMIKAMVQCVQTSGYRGLFEGLSATWFRGMTYALVRFWTYDVAKAEFNRHTGTNTVWNAIGAGVVAGAVGGFVSNPGDIVLIRMQAESGKALVERYGYRNVLDGLYKIARNEGPSKLLRGVPVTVIRAILTNTGQLASYDLAKDQLLNMGLSNGIGCHFLASFAAGTIGTTISQPADVIRSRLMAAGGQANGQTSFTILKQLIQQEGWAALFRGYVPTWSRQTPQTILTFVFLEKLRNLTDFMRSRREPPLGLMAE